MSTLIRQYRGANTTSRTQLADALGKVLSFLLSWQAPVLIGNNTRAILPMLVGPDPAAAKTLLKTLDDAEHLAHKVSNADVAAA